MKKVIILFLLFIGPIYLYAQQELRLRGGVSYSSLNSNPGNYIESGLPGYQFGIDFAMGSNYFVMPGIEYIRMNYEFQEQTTPLPVKDITVLNRIRIPILAGIHLMNPSSKSLLKVNLYTGPSISFVTKVKAKDDLILWEKEDFNDRMWGWNLGATMDIGVFYLQGGYEFGISPVFKATKPNATNKLFYSNIGIKTNL
jgi:hypothetical protein